MAKATVSVLGATTLTSAAERDTNPTKVDITASNWLSFYLEATITNGATAPTAGESVNIFYAMSDQSITAGLAPVQLASRAQSFKVTMTGLANGVAQYESVAIPVRGDFLYVWTNHNVLGAAVSLVLGAVAIEVQGA